MNRIQFIGQTHQGALVSVDDVIRFFDHTMAAYELVGDIEDAQFKGVRDDIHSSMKIYVESQDISRLQDIVTHINDTIHNRKSVYGRSFNIDATMDGNCVELFVRENYQN